jgi:hypothetical protein
VTVVNVVNVDCAMGMLPVQGPKPNMFVFDLACPKTDSQSAILQVYVFPDGRFVVHSGAFRNLLLGPWEDPLARTMSTTS